MKKLILHTGPITPNNIYHGSAESLIPTLKDQSIDAVITSPPYAEQRKGLYPGIPEAEFPTWFAEKIMLPLKSKLKEHANVMVVIHPHVRGGNVSDYVLRTRLAVRDLGFLEPDELIWVKPDGPPLGNYKRPRRTHEQILWFATGKEPAIDLRACGKPSKRRGWRGSSRERRVIHGPQKSSRMTIGPARVSTVLSVPIGGMAHEEGRDHPARYPLALAEVLVRTFAKPGGVVLDPMVGSGTTLEACVLHGRRWIGFDSVPKYANMAKKRAKRAVISQAKEDTAKVIW